MKLTKFFVIILIMAAMGCTPQSDKDNHGAAKEEAAQNPVAGEWVRKTPRETIRLHFFPEGKVEGDFGNDGTVEIRSEYHLKGDTVFFQDKTGQTCPNMGIYTLHQGKHHIAFDLVTDTCPGRVRSIMGFWVHAGYDKDLEEIGRQIGDKPSPALHLERGRMHLALGNPQQARTDLNKYLQTDTTNARVYINRAATFFPKQMEEAIADCNQAITLDPEAKNAYFLRGIARYSLGRKEQACKDFYEAITLGFAVLKEAEMQKCAEYWEEMGAGFM